MRLASVMGFALGTLLCAPSILAATLIYNINGYTMEGGQRIEFAAIEYHQGIVTATYQSAEAASQSTAELKIDAGGATLLPGLIDAHGHVSSYGAALANVDLNGATTEGEATQRVADFIAKADMDSSSWVKGRGWNQVLWPGKAFPTRATLDAVAPDRPVVLGRVDGHAAWVNTAALEAAGINRSTPDPVGGQIIRDSNGEPTGVLIDNAMDVVFETVGEPSVEQLELDIVTALNAVAATGITGVHDAGISAREAQAYRNLQAQGRLPIRVYAMLSVLDPANDDYLDAGPYVSHDGMLQIRSVKISADGALGSRGAALHQSYSDEPGHKGLLLLSDADLRHHIERSANAGFQVNVHAIGDLANTRVLDEFQRINTDPKVRALRHRIEHAQILRPSDIARFRDLGVVASIQPTHATSDKNMAGDRLGEMRLQGAYAWKTLIDNKARVAGGSDFPVEPPEPLFGLHAAVTRTDREGNPLGGWRSHEILSREESLSLFTEWAAYSGHAEELLGRLQPGYAADFILLRDNYFTQPVDDIWRNTVLTTVVGGKVVFASSASPLQ